MKPVILLVDDEVDLVQVLMEAIAHTLPAYEVVCASSVEEAEDVIGDLEATGSELSLVVVDHMLGGRTGIELIEQLKVRYPHVPAVLFTGQAPTVVEARAEQAGARVLWKPIRLKRWLGEVEALLN